jgi:predicted transcriptional regulator of viral defense system
MKALEQFSIIPIDFATLVTLFGDYKSPKDKIASLEKSGELIRLKKGLFVVSSELSGQPVSRELIANHLYGPSYISLESALSFYKLIPERVHTTRSMTLKRARKFSTPVGNFDYITTEKGYYEIGLRQEIIDNRYAFMVATPEKAVCDMLIKSSRLRIQSPKAMRIYLEEDLRIDFSSVETFNIDIIKQCITVGRKKTELLQLYKLLEK